MNLEWFIAKRLLKGDENRSISVPIVKIAIVGIALGLCVMILSIFIVTGFKKEITDKLSGFTAHITVSPYTSLIGDEGSVSGADTLVEILSGFEGVQNVYGYIQKPSILKSKDEIHAVVLRGMSGDFDFTFFKKNLIDGRIPYYVADSSSASNEILLSKYVSDYLNTGIGERIYAHFVDESSRGSRIRPFEIVGIYNTGFKEFDDLVVVCDVKQLRRLNSWKEDEVSIIGIEVENLAEIDVVSNDLKTYITQTGDNYEVQPLYEVAKPIFHWLQLLDKNVWVIIILLVAVAGVNMISGLLILILEKTSLIGLLKALGAKNISIRKIFLYISAGLIMKGMVWGNMVALLFAFIQWKFELISLDPVTYYMDKVPINFNILYLLLLNIGVILVTILMLIIPTMLISKISPIKSIKFK